MCLISYLKGGTIDKSLHKALFSYSSFGEPLNAILPFSNTINSSESNVSSTSWVIDITVKSLFSLLIFEIKFKMSLLPLGSSIEVASSKINTFGFITKAPAIATLCFWPPER